MAAGEDHAARIEGAHEVGVHVVRMKLAIDPGFAHAARDQLRHLRAEIENEDTVEGGRKARGARREGVRGISCLVPRASRLIQRGNSVPPW